MVKKINMKAVFAALMVFFVAAAMMPVQAMAGESADSKMCFYAGDVTAAPGETIEVPVFVRNNSGMSSTKIFLNSSSEQNVYPVVKSDGKSLQVKPGAVFFSGSILTNTVDQGALILWYSTGDVEENGQLFTVKFKVADNAKEGTYRISISYSKGDTANVKGDNLDVLTEAGTVTVKKAAGSGGNSSGSGSAGSGSGSGGSGSGASGGTVTPGTDNTQSGTAGDEDFEEKGEASLTKKEIIAAVKATDIKLSSKLTKLKSKKAIKLSWTVSGEGRDYLDGYAVHRSTKKSKGYGTKPYKTVAAGKMSYTNSKSLKKGKTYYFKVRGYVEIDGKKYYTDWSNKAWRKIK